MGKVYNVFSKVYDEDKLVIVGLVDNNRSKWNTAVNGINIIPPDRLVTIDYDLIIITSMYVEKIRNQLLELGVNRGKIYNFFSIYKKLTPMDNEIWNDILKENFMKCLVTQ